MSDKSLSVLSAASARGDADSVRELLAAGADVNTVDDLGQTALIKAVHSGDEETVSVLLKAGADVDIADSKDGYTALFHAVERQDLRMVQLLLDASPCLRLTDVSGCAVIMRAVFHWSLDVLLALLLANEREVGAKHWYLNTGNLKSPEGFEALALAASLGKVQYVETLAHHGASLESKAKDGLTALLRTCKQGSSDMVRCLIQLGASVQARDFNDRTALHLVGHGDWAEIVFLLVQAGLSLEETGRFGKTPLLVAAAVGNLPLLNLLIDLGADIDAFMPLYKKTPLMLAVCGGHYACVRALVEAGADIEAVSLPEESALQDAISWHEKAPREDPFVIVRYLADAGANVNKFIGSSDAGPYIGIYNALIWALHQDSDEAVKILLERGAQVAIFRRDGSWPLLYQSQGFIKTMLSDCVGEWKWDESTVRKASHKRRPMDPAERPSVQELSCSSPTYSLQAGIDCLRFLGSQIQETTHAWDRIIQRLEDAIPEFNSATGFAVYRSIWRSLYGLATFYGSQHRMSRVLKAGAMMEALYGVHIQLDELMTESKSDDASSVWKEQWMSDCQMNRTLLMELLKQNEPLATDTTSELQQNEALMLLTYESEKLKSSYTPTAIYSIHHFLQLMTRVSQTPLPPIPKWFIAPCEIELHHSKAWVVGSAVDYGSYCGLPVMIKYQVIEDSDQTERFVQYVQLWYELQHPGLLRFYGAYHLGKRAFLVYEKTSTDTLETYLYRYNVQLYGSDDDLQCHRYRMVWRLLHQVAEALVFLHGHSILNTDLEMRSILVDCDGNAKLRCNFGKIRLSAPEQLPLKPEPADLEVSDAATEAELFERLIYDVLLLVDPVKNQVVSGRRSFIHGTYWSIIERLRSKRCSIEDVIEDMRILTERDPPDNNVQQILPMKDLSKSKLQLSQTYAPEPKVKARRWFQFKR